MGFHLQLYPPKLSAWVIVLLVLFLPATLTAYFLHNLAWLVDVPFGIIVLALFIAALPIKRKVTPEQFADELESHLLGTGGPSGEFQRTKSCRVIGQVGIGDRHLSG